MPTVDLLVATSNKGKIRELSLLLNDLPLRLHTLAEFPDVSEVEETGITFSQNAALKARLYATQTGLLTLADDSGLEVDALNGAPGVFSARYGVPDMSYADRMKRILTELKQTNDAEQRARFVCVIAIADPLTKDVNLFIGKCEGRISDEPRGTNGFGYDPIFIPDGYSQTFGELPDETKQKLSHRALAIKAAHAFLARNLTHP